MNVQVRAPSFSEPEVSMPSEFTFWDPDQSLGDDILDPENILLGTGSASTHPDSTCQASESASVSSKSCPECLKELSSQLGFSDHDDHHDTGNSSDSMLFFENSDVNVTQDSPLARNSSVGPPQASSHTGQAPRQSGTTVLHQACRQGHLQIVRLLHFRGALLDTTDGTGKTALHVACEEGHEGIVRYLLEQGIDIDRRDGAGMTPLYVAASQGREDVVALLLERGANPNAWQE